MKRFLSIFAIATVAFAFVACGGKGTKTEEAEATATETVENVESAAPAASEKSALAQYEEFINKVIDLYPKVKAGDVDAMKEYQKLSEEMTAVSTQLSQEMSTMSAEDAQKFAELGQKLAAAMQ
ncbi:hypothetical protein [Bacteroides sp. 51]|uniref:hypothetical protein n=1 Tax=Bacteroides sp. 51 TaxID=2302938 RepID=UPI0013D0533E|nr:hypothetical protein [Bacteroides sp. 51]NDV84505.1 hypothetical protein [Bacteroides sp. 51]